MLVWKHKKTTAFFVLLSVLYLAQVLLVKPDQDVLDKYNVSRGQIIALSLTIALPYIVIWFFGLIGYLRLHEYSNSIKKGRDGVAFRSISIGIFLLTLWLPLSTLLAGVATQLYDAHPAYTDDLVRLLNYLNLLILYPAFVYVHKGSRQLLPLTKTSIQSLSQKLTMAFIGFSALYVYLTLNDPARHMPTGSTKVASYYQPDWLIVLTLVIPRLLMWFMGVQAVQNLFLYRRRVKGSIYQASLDSLAWGLAGVVIASVVLRCVQSLTTVLSDLSLGVLLIVVYALLIVIGVGYVLIAKGARKLQKIEEF